MVVLLPICSDEEAILVDYDPAIVNFVPIDWLRKPIFYADVAGPLDGLVHRDDGLENYGEAAGSLRRENISLRGTDHL